MNHQSGDTAKQQFSNLIMQAAWNSMSAVEDELERLELQVDDAVLHQIHEIIKQNAKRI